MADRDGEYIELWWDQNDNPEYVRGHVTDEVAYAAVDSYCGIGPAESNPFTCKHRWARWEFPSGWARSAGLDSVMRTYDEKGRGMFAVTELVWTPRPAPPRQGTVVMSDSPVPQPAKQEEP